MASRRILNDTVVLCNYVGEINDVATFQETIIKNCRLNLINSSSINSHSKTTKDSGRLYIFDKHTIAISRSGEQRMFVPSDKWNKLIDKSKSWTINDGGLDYIRLEDSQKPYKIIGFAYRKVGTKRMWHFEVDLR